MKTFYACKKTKINEWVWYSIFGVFLIVLIYQIFSLAGIIPHHEKSYILILNIIAYTFLIFQLIYNRYMGCSKHFVRFEDDQLVYQTAKNKLTTIPYKDIDSHEIHIFEIIFHLKNGEKKILNLDNFVYENIRKIKETLLKKLG